MSKVELYKLQNDGSHKIVATCRLQDEIAVCEGDEILVSNLNQEGIRNYNTIPMITIFPKDGVVFLEQLKNNFKTGYLNASDLLSEDPNETKQ